MGGALSSSSSSSGGSKKKTPTPAISDVDRAILDLKNARDRLTKYNLELESSIQKLLERARVAKDAGRTQTALGLLRLKKYKQSQVDNVQTQLLNVHQMVETIDSQQRNAQIVQSLKAGKDALKQLHEETSVEDVLTLMDEIAEQNDVEQEITDVLQNAVPSLSVEAEAAVEAELAALESELLPQQQPDGEKVPDMPVEPHTKLPEVKQQEQVKPQSQPEKRVPIAG